MHKVYIVGAGGFGREVLAWLLHSPQAGKDWSVEGFLDDNAKALEGFTCSHKIVGAIEDYFPQSHDLLVLGLTTPSTKSRLAEKLLRRDAKFLNYIHPRAIVGSDVRVGPGCLICPGAVVTVNIKLGSFVTLNIMSSVGNDADVGSFATFSPYAGAMSGSKLGPGVLLGAHSLVMPNVSVEAWATVGAGSVAFRKVPEGMTVMGVPAKQIGFFAKAKK